MRAVEPALAAGATIVIGYGLAGRLLPGIVELARSRSAGGRLEQPITYWNAEGALAAMGLVLCARLAGDRRARRAMRAAAAAAAGAARRRRLPVLLARGDRGRRCSGWSCSSRPPRRARQLRAAAVALAPPLAAAACAAVFPGVASLEGPLGDRTRDGAIALALLARDRGRRARWSPSRTAPRGRRASRWSRAGSAASAAAVAPSRSRRARRRRPRRAAERRRARRGRRRAAGSRRRARTATSTGAWRCAAFGREPLTGLGAGGFRVVWLQERPIAEAVRDTHSIELEMAAELGLVGLLALRADGRRRRRGGARRAAARARGRPPARARRALVWFLHASIDWDWQLPAVSAARRSSLAGALIALSESPRARAGPAGAARRAPAAAVAGSRSARERRRARPTRSGCRARGARTSSSSAIASRSRARAPGSTQRPLEVRRRVGVQQPRVAERRLGARERCPATSSCARRARSPRCLQAHVALHHREPGEHERRRRRRRRRGRATLTAPRRSAAPRGRKTQTASTQTPTYDRGRHEQREPAARPRRPGRARPGRSPTCAPARRSARAGSARAGRAACPDTISIG